MVKQNLPKRKSIRLKNYDYSMSGYYYVTICTQDRKCLFGDIVGVGRDQPEMVLNNAGKIVKNIWKSLPNHHHFIKLDEFKIMPNHIHFVIQIVGATRGSPFTQINDSGGSRPAPTGLGTIVGLFKSECTKQIRHLFHKSNIIIWQRNYYEHVIRTGDDLNKIREYININPTIWDRDRNNPGNCKL